MKIRIKYRHNNNNYNCTGIIINNKIIFNNNGDKLKIECNSDFVNIEKTNDEGIIYLMFKLNEITRSMYKVNDMGTVYLNIKTNTLLIENNRIYIEYTIIESNDKHIYSLEYEVI